MTARNAKVVGVGVGILFTALWALPLAHAISLVRWSQRYVAETSSINASNDLKYSIALLSSYSISLVAALVVAWFMFHRPRKILILPLALIVLAVLEVLRSRPESPIVLFPTVEPWRPALVSLVAVGIGAWFRCGMGPSTKRGFAEAPSSATTPDSGG